jgi:RND family efflux transporter MFP subunit
MSYKNLLFFLIMMVACNNKASKKNNENLKIENKISNQVDIFELNSKIFKIKLISNGLLKSPQQSQLFFKSQVEITKIYANNTHYVKQGMVLATLDNRSSLLAIQQAQDQLKKAHFTLNKLLIDYGGKDLDTNSVKPRFLESIKVQSGYYEAQTALKNAKMQYDNTFLIAPFAGIIANLKTKAHNQASLIEPFCTILNPKNLEVEAFILESELKVITLGQKASVLPLANINKTYAGIVSEINPQVEKSGLISIKIKILNPDPNLLDGMNARVEIEKTITNQLVVPKSAIVDRSGRKVVFTFENGLAKWHYVTVVYENDTEAAISEGLKLGEQVIITGNLNLGHDAKVILKK